MNKLYAFSVCLLLSLYAYSDKFVWNQKAPYPSFARHRCCAFTIGNKGYMGTGHINSGTISQAYTDWWEYDPATDSWTQKADYPLPRFACSAFTIGNKAYMGAGNEQNFGGRDEFFEFDPLQNTWTPKASFPVAAGGNIAFAINGKGYMGLGGGSSIYMYDPALDTWTPSSANIPASDYSSCFVINNKAYVLPAWSNTFYMYDPATNSTVTKAPFIGDGRYAAASFAVRGQGYIGMGWSSVTSNLLKDFYFYDPATDTWDTIPKAFPGVRRNYVPSFVIGDNAYFGTGSNGTNLGDIWGYEWKLSVGVDEKSLSAGISLYPNPTRDYLTVHVSDKALGLHPVLSIYQFDGKLVSEQTLQQETSRVNTSSLPEGAYMTVIHTAGGNILCHEKLIKN
ncbi:MAG: T9SS type A sorting domain-containing protein [Bacteroidetes bacterium]|nr:T9SS type A sorting domain-containing protein [Bacteroidota bacterium]